VQVVDDMTGRTIASASSVEPTVKGTLGKKAKGGNVAGAQAIGKTIAERLLEKGVKRVVFDRNGFLYHGRVKAVADAAREAGLEF
jgi:large subunit ribosomal protein L18